MNKNVQKDYFITMSSWAAGGGPRNRGKQWQVSGKYPGAGVFAWGVSVFAWGPVFLRGFSYLLRGFVSHVIALRTGCWIDL